MCSSSRAVEREIRFSGSVVKMLVSSKHRDRLRIRLLYSSLPAERVAKRFCRAQHYRYIRFGTFLFHRVLTSLLLFSLGVPKGGLYELCNT